MDHILELVDRFHDLDLRGGALEIILQAVFGETGAKITVLRIAGNGVLEFTEFEPMNNALQEVQEWRENIVEETHGGIIISLREALSKFKAKAEGLSQKFC
jgi:hypothetical protein